MRQWFRYFQNCTYLDLGNMCTDNLISLYETFNLCGPNVGLDDPRTFEIKGLENWNVSNVKYFVRTFDGMARLTRSFSVSNLSNWNPKSGKNFTRMFYGVGQGAQNEWTLGDLNKWDMNNAETIDNMFAWIGRNNPNFIMPKISDWNLQNLRSAVGVFAYAGQFTESYELDLSGWDFQNKTSDNLNISGLLNEINAYSVKLPKNISSNAALNVKVTNQVWYDITDQNKKYEIGKIPTDFAESHTLWDADNFPLPVSDFYTRIEVDETKIHKLGDTITAKYIFENTGNVPLTNVNVQLSLTSDETGDIKNVTNNYGTGGNNVTIQKVNPNETVEIIFTHTVTDEDILHVPNNRDTTSTLTITTDCNEMEHQDTHVAYVYTETKFQIVIQYIYREDGTQAADTLIDYKRAGEMFLYESPKINGFVPDYTTVRCGSEGMPSRDITIIVQYEKVPS